MTLVTIIVPARNEEAAIESCLRAVLAQDHPHDRLEVLVVDGWSEDGTADVAKRVLDGSDLAHWDVLRNVDRRTPSNLNMGLAAANGEIIARVDARSIIGPDYIRRTVAVLQDPSMAVVGGRQRSVPGAPGPIAAGIARALDNPVANGGSRYRNPHARSGESDTAYLGVFRTDQLRSVGGWSTELASNQDFDLARRMRRFGGVWFSADLVVDYRPRPTLRRLFAQYRRFGGWKVVYWRLTGDRPRPRQLVLLAVPAVGVAAGLLLLARRPGLALRSGIAAIAALAAVDHLTGPNSSPLADRRTPVPPGERLASIAAMATIGIGWWSGAIQELLQPRAHRVPNDRTP